MLLAAAVVAGVIALSERGSARSAATAEAAQRLGAQALSEERVDQALRLATAGVALDDSVATRSSLLSTLLRNPAAIRVLTPTGEELPALALSPDGETLAASDADGTVTLFDTDTYEVVGEHQAPATAYVIAFDPQGDSLAVAEDSSATGERWRFSTRLPGGCAARPRLPPAKGSCPSASSSTLRTDEACSSPTPAVTPCSCVGTTPAGARRSESPYASGASISRWA